MSTDNPNIPLHLQPKTCYCPEKWRNFMIHESSSAMLLGPKFFPTWRGHPKDKDEAYVKEQEVYFKELSDTYGEAKDPDFHLRENERMGKYNTPSHDACRRVL